MINHNIKRIFKYVFAILFDCLLCFIAVWISYFLRLGYWEPIFLNNFYKPITAFYISFILMIPLLWLFGLYKTILVYFGFHSTINIIKSSFIYLFLYAFLITFVEISGIPRTIGIIQPIILFLLILLSRSFFRYYFIINGTIPEKFFYAKQENILIYGTGIYARNIADVILNAYQSKLIGFVTNDIHLINSSINGVNIYSDKDIHKIVKKNRIDKVIIALSDESHQQRSEVVKVFVSLKVSVCVMPDIEKMVNGRIVSNAIEELDINDLLNRENTSIELSIISKNIESNVILVTGAGGSIGSELCRQLLKFNPKYLILFEINEYALYNIYSSLLNQNKLNLNDQINIIPILGSCLDKKRLNDLFLAFKPNIIYHAAAYKHVTIVENNPTQGVLNNVFSTKNIAELCCLHNVKNMVLISTDKAVNPTNIMGASKRLSEMILQALSENNTITNFSIVRFGNVLGSSGSVIPLFKKQINEGGPLTLTHAEVTRYFMTTTEAAKLVIQAGVMGAGGDIFYLEMGKPVRILDLAQNMIYLSGLRPKSTNSPFGDIEIKFIGLRPGEKLHEELQVSNEIYETNHPKIKKVFESYIKWQILSNELDQLEFFVKNHDIVNMISLILKIIPEFDWSKDVTDHVYKMKNLK
jgi:FlaA1/EpsC-like NDP-sugar epimerase